MATDRATLAADMRAAAAAGEYERAARLRDELRALDTVDEAEPHRQVPGAMGLGTSRQRVTPPPGWTPPPKPDPLTAGRSRRRGR